MEAATAYQVNGCCVTLVWAHRAKKEGVILMNEGQLWLPLVAYVLLITSYVSRVFPFAPSLRWYSSYGGF